MKKIALLCFSIFLFFAGNSDAQLLKDSWSYGFGVSYPHYVSTSFSVTQISYGGYGAIQRNFSEHVGTRLKLKYAAVNGEWGGGKETVTTNSISGDVDLIYYWVPCEVISPYNYLGVGGLFFSHDNVPGGGTWANESHLDFQVNIGFGFEFQLTEAWRMVADLGYHTPATSGFDGSFAPNGGGLLGGAQDTYMMFDLGLTYFFDKGEPSKFCQLYEGISVKDMPDPVDYERLENIIKKYIPKEVIKEVVVDRQSEGAVAGAVTYGAPTSRWVLVGVNFDFNRAGLRPESYPILFHAVQVLLQNPGMKIEVQGHTDNIGAEQGNKRISDVRANVVKSYLVSKGVSADRIRTVGYGETRPVTDNRTAQGRAMNRRIEFKILN
ncbi:MAG: OmpA family protein [Bacteroidetes bacterium]|nr:OmpA family protein [Bacteroidota bacterium]